MNRRKLDPHQVRALRFIRKRDGRAGVFMAPGTGKTLVAIRYGRSHLPVLIVCRRDDFLTWEQELELEGVPPEHIFFIESSKYELPDCIYPWTIITYDLMKNDEIYRWIISAPYFETVIGDETQMIKRWKSNRTKKVIRATEHCPHKLALTGTPITNEVEDVFSQGLFIDGGETFGTNHWKFLNRYYIRQGPGWYVKSGVKAKVSKQLEQIAFHVHEDDVLDLPPIRRLIKGVSMTGMQRRYYEKVLTEWEIELKGKNPQVIEFDHVLTQMQKLRQIAGGFVYDEDKKAHWLKSSKLKLLLELIDDKDYLGCKPKIVIWCAFTAEIERIKKELDTIDQQSVIFRGNRKVKEQARKDFRDIPRIRFFIGNVDSGVGMNELIVADTAVYYSNSHRTVSRQQSMRRIRRRGSEHHKVITYYDLVTEHTIDVHMIKCLRTSMSVAKFILDRIRDGISIREILM